MAVAHNGDIANAAEIREELSKKGWAFMTTSDSEVIVRLLANEIVNSGGEVKRALKEFTARLVGAYSLALMINDTVYAVRDPLAVRPLCIGEGHGRFMNASESVVFDTLGFEFILYLKPGEIVELRPDGFESMRLPHPNHTAHYMFVRVHFAGPYRGLGDRLVSGVHV